MRSLNIHPGSLVAGALLAGLALLSMSQAPVLNARTINVQYVPDPRDYVQVRGDAPYTVPAGKLFVLTALGTTTGLPVNVQPVLRVDGQARVRAYGNGPSTDSGTMQSMPSGLTAASGSEVSIIDGFGCTTPTCMIELQAWGYLAPQ